MGFIADFKSLRYRKRLAAALAQLGGKNGSAGYDGPPINPDTAKHIAILFVADSAEDRKHVDRWRDRFERKHFELIGAFDHDVAGTSFDFTAIGPKQTNWYGVPQGAEIDKFLSRPCDLLLRVGPAEHPVLDYLATLKRARLKVGPHSSNPGNPFHLRYSAETKTSAQQQLAEIDRIFSYVNAHPVPQL